MKIEKIEPIKVDVKFTITEEEHKALMSGPGEPHGIVFEHQVEVSEEVAKYLEMKARMGPK